MNARFSALLIASLVGLALSGPVMAEPRFMDRDFRDFSAREDRTMERDFGRKEERQARKEQKQQDKRNERKADQEQERGYGYGYERRNRQHGPDNRGHR